MFLQTTRANYAYKTNFKRNLVLVPVFALLLLSAFSAEAKKRTHKKENTATKAKSKKASKSTTSTATAAKARRVSSTQLAAAAAPNANVIQLRQNISLFAETFLGLPYVLGGYSQTNGFDCSGFTRFVLGNFNINTGLNAREQSAIGEQIPVDWTRPGDLIFFGSPDNISHVALVYANDATGITIVHSCSRGVVKENITNSGYWKPKMLFAINIVGM
jgi:cell wall-associated NlpC family hydrolase